MFVPSVPILKFADLAKGSKVLPTDIWMANGRSALQLVARVLQSRARRSRVLFPAFICKSVVNPFLLRGFKADFYDVDLMLQPNLGSLAAKINDETAAVVVNHNFGFFLESISEIKTLCLARDILLLEDCSHSLPIDKRIGHNGDISFFSLRKMVGIPEGCIVHIADDSIREHALKMIDGKSLSYLLMATKNYLVIAGLEVQELLGLDLRVAESFIWKVEKRIFGQRFDLDTGDWFEFAAMKGAYFSKWLFEHIELSRTASRRREQFTKYLRSFEHHFGKDDVIPLFSKLDAETIPYEFPVLVKKDRDLKRRRLWENGIRTHIIWSDIPTRRESKEFPVANRLSNEILSFPVHSILHNNVVGEIRDILSINQPSFA